MGGVAAPGRRQRSGRLRALIVGWTLGRLEKELGVQVLGLRRVGFEHHPPSDRELAVGDGIVVSATPEGLDKLACLTPPTRELGRYRQGRWQLRPVNQ